jgi:PAS domain S-box-containing protein
LTTSASPPANDLTAPAAPPAAAYKASSADALSLSGPPRMRHPGWIRAAATGVTALVFWLDVIAPDGIAVSALYVAPALLFIAAGEYWEPLLVAAGATLLIALGGYLSHPGAGGDLGVVNRGLALVVVWVSAGVVAQYRRTLARWATQYATDRRALDASVRRLEEIEYALNQAAIVAATDQRGVITFVNEKFCEISKYPREELIGQDHRLINSAFHPKGFIRDLWRTIAQGRVWRGELRNRARDGTFYWVDTTIVPFLDEAGKPRQYLAIRSDITQRKAAEERLADQAALAQLGQLAAVVAHEVRNPLAGVKGSLQIFRGRAAPDSRDRQVIDAMIARLDALNAKVEDILRFARPRTPTIESVDVRGLVIDAIASARAGSDAGIMPPERTAQVRADREMLRAVFLNLLQNACQAGPADPIEVTVEVHQGMCRITIADRGSGIAADDQDRVFEPFFTTKKTGTGLGLAIVKRFLALQNGDVRLGPRAGGGTVAEVEIPIAAASSQE